MTPGKEQGNTLHDDVVELTQRYASMQRDAVANRTCNQPMMLIKH